MYLIILKFQVNIKRPDDEGLYIFNFFNCFQPQASKKLGMDNYFSASNLDELRTGINLDVSYSLTKYRLIHAYLGKEPFLDTNNCLLI